MYLKGVPNILLYGHLVCFCYFFLDIATEKDNLQFHCNNIPSILPLTPPFLHESCFYEKYLRTRFFGSPPLIQNEMSTGSGRKKGTEIHFNTDINNYDFMIKHTNCKETDMNFHSST